MLLVTSFALWSCSRGDHAVKAESITIGMDPNAANSLILIAASQNYFAVNGLNVTIKDYISGLAAVNGMLNNEADFATAAEFVIVGKVLNRENIRTLAIIDKFMQNYIVGRKDRGIENIADLKGKRIGVPLKTAPEFYLGRFLELHGMNLKQVTLVDVQPAKAVDALVNGDIDAVAVWQPNVKAIEDRLGNRIVEWRAQNEQATYRSIVSIGTWITNHPDPVKRLLSSLAQAENYLVRHPDEGRAIINQKLQWDDAYVAAIWPQHQFYLSLDQALIAAMEDEARWMIKNNLTSEKQVPDFVNYIYTDGLKAIRPEAVNIIR